MSISCHLRASISPWRIPVVTASTYRASSLSSRAACRNLRVSSVESGRGLDATRPRGRGNSNRSITYLDRIALVVVDVTAYGGNVVVLVHTYDVIYFGCAVFDSAFVVVVLVVNVDRLASQEDLGLR